ncbi:biotin synthase BioB [Sphingosinicella sp. LHD-64]|uniref:biotin synthase BioB n=1 Tax=Sphingosinicella sp. LHD-64 TaxID=3072139 RepID=UPI00280F27F8|nr:biotin synthase BioB [Sphingosinicella sp. LHD-64]MDQ8758080.1 biotin synthase BioB [Sphingosinicella sp. LHD-64]
MLKQVQHDEEVRNDWTRAEIADLFDLPLMDLVFEAQRVHRAHHAPNEVQLSTLLSIKTGGCPEDCGYCSQSVHAETGLKATKLMDVRAVLQAAAQARDHGSTRFCMGAAWRNPKDRDMPAIVEMVKGVRAMGMETCMTLGMLSETQARMLAEAGLDYYNHNIDTSPERYNAVISTRTFEDRLETLDHVRASGMSVCCGGIVGMGETRDDRVGFIHALATLPQHPESVPVNALVPVKGTVLGDMLADTPLAKIDDIEFVRTVAAARITMPESMVRLSAGRESMSESTQALCFLAGANSIFTGDKLLTAPNAGDDKDAAMFAKLGIKAMHPQSPRPGPDPAPTFSSGACAREKMDAGSSPA